MEKMGVISRISEPTDWCTGMVVVPEANGKVRTCVDLTHLNNNVCRERHPLPLGNICTVIRVWWFIFAEIVHHIMTK